MIKLVTSTVFCMDTVKHHCVVQKGTQGQQANTELKANGPKLNRSLTFKGIFFNEKHPIVGLPVYQLESTF